MIEAFSTKRVLGASFLDYWANKKILREGLEVSYGSKNLKAALFGSFKNYIVEVEDIPLLQPTKPYKFGVPNTVTIVVRNAKQFQEQSDELNRILNQQGYGIVKHTMGKNNVDIYQFEPKYPVTLSKNAIASFRVFHITEKDRQEKILRLGLNPKDSRTSFKHKGNRIYLFATNNPQHHIPILSKELSMRIDDEGTEVKKKMVAFEVDKEGIFNEDLYLDESFQYKPNSFFAFFTLYSIRPDYLKEFHE
jgi:hypothetical protein